MTQPNQPNQPSSETPRDENAPQRALRFVGELFQYYGANLGEMFRFGIEITPFLERPGDRNREIRITKEDAVGSDAFDGQNWQLTFPDCCVVTGERADGDWIEREVTLQNVAAPFYGLAAGLFFGLMLSSLIAIWLWSVFVLIGMGIGFAYRQTRRVRLRYRKSASGAEKEDVDYPLVWLLPDGLLVRLGSSSAKKAFVKHRVDRQEADRAGAIQIAPRREVETLKLDEEPTSREISQPQPLRPREDLPPIRMDEE